MTGNRTYLAFLTGGVVCQVMKFVCSNAAQEDTRVWSIDRRTFQIIVQTTGLGRKQDYITTLKRQVKVVYQRNVCRFVAGLALQRNGHFHFRYPITAWLRQYARRSLLYTDSIKCLPSSFQLGLYFLLSGHPSFGLPAYFSVCHSVSVVSVTVSRSLLLPVIVYPCSCTARW